MSNANRRVVLLELNEVNFDFVREYCEQGKLPEFKKLLDDCALYETQSESRYEELEPWIQWVTAHTGKSLKDHGVFRLGDIVKHDHEQIWEELEDSGVSVGAISPMNASNKTRQAKFFIPDPWTDTRITGSFLAKKLYSAIAQAVNDNSSSRITAASKFWLAVSVMIYTPWKGYPALIRAISRSREDPWFKAIILDMLLANVFVALSKKHAPEFSSVFMNAAAHIQHHYMFNSSAYEGSLSNPAWYVSPDADPVFDIYEVYDRILATIRMAMPDARLLVATGLHQDPHPEVTYYWRLSDHAAYLSKIGVKFQSVEPRMSRDFLIVFADEQAAIRGQELLESARSHDDVPLFDVDNRGSDLFVMLTYPHAIDDGFRYRIGGRELEDFGRDVSFVAIKNGQHNGTGYLVDTGGRPSREPTVIPLTDVPALVRAALA